jgi:DNA-binding SARP family transcriptional activator
LGCDSRIKAREEGKVVAEFLALGSLSVVSSGKEVRVGGLRQQKLLALLVLNANRVTPLDHLVDELWENPPQSARQQIHNSIGEIRRTLHAASVKCRIVTTSVGYQLEVPSENTDLYLFHQRVHEAWSAEQQGQLPRATDLLKSALELWRGSPFAGINSPALANATLKLNEDRLAALDRLITLRLKAGEAPSVIGELQGLVAEYPLHESFRYNLMAALSETGRQAEALTLFDEGRRELADELGLDPSPRLSSLQHAILNGNLHHRDEGPRSGATAPVPGPAEGTPSPDRSSAVATWFSLPHDIMDFSGRSEEVRSLLAEARRTRSTALVISAIDGMGGIGKTTLAVHIAHLLADDYPDGQYFVDLHGFSLGIDPIAPEQALGRLLRASGMPPELIPLSLEDRSGAWRARMAGKQVLVVLDNATDSTQVRPLIPGTPTGLVLVTSRRKLGALEGSIPLSLDVLSRNDAMTLFAQIVGAQRVAEDPENAAKAVELCGRLPLAIRIAAARLRYRSSWTIADLVERLITSTRRAQFLKADDRSVMAVLKLSYRYLSPEQQTIFRLLSMHPGADVDIYSAAALTGLSPDEIECELEVLYEFNLLRQRASGRFFFHDLIRDCARQLLPLDESESQRRDATRALLDYYVHAVHRCCEQLDSAAWLMSLDGYQKPHHVPDVGSHQEATRLLAAEYQNLLSVAKFAFSNGFQGHSWRLLVMLVPFMKLSNFRDASLDLFRQALLAAEADRDMHGRSACLHALALILAESEAGSDAKDHLKQAIALSGECRDLKRHSLQLVELGVMYFNEDRLAEAEEALLEAQAVDGDVIDDALRVKIANNLGVVYRDLGKLDDSLAKLEYALSLNSSNGPRHMQFHILWNIGMAFHLTGRNGESASRFQEALHVSRAAEFRFGEALALSGLSSVLRSRGNFPGSVEAGRDALDISRDFGLGVVECEALCALGEVAFSSGDIDHAHATFSQAEATSRRYGYRRYIARSLEGIAHVSAARGDIDQAREHWKTAAATYPAGMADAAYPLQHVNDQSGDTHCFRCELQTLVG